MACSTPQENFVKFSSLLLDEGTLTLAERVKHEIANDCSCATFTDFIEKNKHTLFHLFERRNCCQCSTPVSRYDKAMSYDQWSCLFKDTTKNCKTSTPKVTCCCRFIADSNLDITTLDISLLSAILLNICSLSKNEKEKIKHIRKQRNKYFAHSSMTEMDEVTYLKEFKDTRCTLEAIGKTVGCETFNKIKKRIDALEKSTISNSLCRHLICMLHLQKETTKEDSERIERELQEIRKTLEEMQDKEKDHKHDQYETQGARPKIASHLRKKGVSEMTDEDIWNQILTRIINRECRSESRGLPLQKLETCFRSDYGSTYKVIKSFKDVAGIKLLQFLLSHQEIYTVFKNNSKWIVTLKQSHSDEDLLQEITKENCKANEVESDASNSLQVHPKGTYASAVLLGFDNAKAKTEFNNEPSFQKTKEYKNTYASITASRAESEKCVDEMDYKVKSKNSLTYSSNDEIEKFMQYVNNFKKGHFVLLCSKLSSLKFVEAIALVQWLCVFDFDEYSRSDGLLSRVEDKIRERRSIQVSTWKDTPQLSHKGTQWCLLRGSVQEAESRTPSDYKSWMACIRQDYEKYLNEMTKFQEFTTLKAVVLWPNDENVQFMFLALLKMTEISGLEVILCDHIFNQSVEEQSLLKIIQPNLTVKQPLQDIFRHMSKLMHTDKDFSSKRCVYKLPTADGTNDPGIDGKMAADFREDLHVLYLNTDPYKNGSEEDFSLFDLEEEERNFFRGGNLQWFAFYEAGSGHFDAERDLTKLVVEHIKINYISKFKSGKITLFHEPGSGGTTLGQQILWSLRTETPCLQVEMNMTSTVTALINRIEIISKKTNLPLVLLIDGDDQHKVSSLYKLVNHLMIIFIHICRLILKPNSMSEDEFWLSGKVSRQEVKKLAIKFTVHCDNDSKKDKITDLVRDVERGKVHLMYEFGMIVFLEDFKGVHSYVKGYLQLDQNPQNELQPWQKILGYLSLVYYYGQTSIPCQFFVTLLSCQNNYDVSIDDFPFQVRQFIVSSRFEGKPNCIRICHYIVAKEILEQLLTWRKRKLKEETGDSDTYRLSHTARMGMYDFVMQLLEDIRSRKIKAAVKSGRITDILTRTLILRYNRDVEDNEVVRGKISRLLDDIPCKAPFTERINILKKLTEIFPSDPNFHAHLGRMYSICRPEDEKKAEDCFGTAVHLMANWREISDFDESIKQTMKYVYHMYGIFCNQKITNLVKRPRSKTILKPEDFDRIMEMLIIYAKEACSYFSKTRAITLYGFEDAYGYVGEMTTRLLICEFVHKQTFFKDLNEVYTHRVEMVEFVKKSITVILELIYQCYSCVNPDDIHKEFYRKIYWYNALFGSITHSFDSELKNESIHTRRVHNAVMKLQFGVESTLHTLDCITSASRINEIVLNCEKNFKDLAYEDIDLKRAAIDLDYKDWLLAIRHKKFVQIYTLEEVLLHVRYWHDLLKSPSAKFYLFILVSLIGFGDIEESNPSTELLTEAKEILEDLSKIGRSVSRQRAPKEWLGRGPGIRCLIPARFDYKPGETEYSYSDSDNSDRVVLKGTICRPNEKRQTGFIELDLGDNVIPVRVLFVPIRTAGPLMGKRYAGERVEFVLAFTYASGYEAFNVALLKKYPCVCSRMVEITSDKYEAKCLCGQYVHVSREED